MRALLLALILTAAPVATLANDSMAELKTGGLQYVRSDAVTMLREDLSISLDKVSVDYTFRNTSEVDVESLVAFPMPDLVPSPYEGSPIPTEDENFLGFKVFVEGEEIQPELSQRALAFGVDVTDEVRGMGIPLMPLAQNTQQALIDLPKDVIDDWVTRGVVYPDVYDDGDGTGMRMHPWPNWTLQQVYSWRMAFPAGKDVHVSHTYQPSVGGTAGLVFWSYDGKRSEEFDNYAKKYCLDSDFEKAVKKRWPGETTGDLPLWESRISYILTTANNWYGPIGTFHLTIDKGKPSNLVSFCADGVKKTGPTTFEVTYSDYYPDRDLDLLILQSSTQ